MTLPTLSTHSVSDVLAEWDTKFTARVGGTKKPTAAPVKKAAAKKATKKPAKKTTTKRK